MTSDTDKLINVRIAREVTVVEFVRAKMHDISTIEELERAFNNLVDTLPTSRLLVDFDRVDFMVTRVINLLLILLRRTREAGGDVWLCGMNENIHRVFVLMRLTQIFVIYEDQAAALAELRR